MKASSLGTMLWILALGLFGLGVFMIVDLLDSTKTVRAESEAYWKKHTAPKIEGFGDNKGENAEGFVFPAGLRLVPGDPEVAYVKPVVIKNGTDGPVEIKKPKINLRAEADKLGAEVKEELELQWVMLVRTGKVVDQIASQAMLLRKAGAYDEKSAPSTSRKPPPRGRGGRTPTPKSASSGKLTSRNSFFLHINDKVSSAPMSYLSVGHSEVGKLPEVLKDATLIEILKRQVVFAVTTPAFQELCKKALEEDEAEARKVIDDKMRFMVVIEMDAVESPVDPLMDGSTTPEDIVKEINVVGNKLDDEKKAEKSETNSDVAKRNEALIAKIKAEKIAEQERLDRERENANNKIPETSTNDKDGNLTLGQDLYDQEIYKGLENQVETYIDPKTKEAAGVRVSRSYSPSEGSALRKYGAKSGDIIKSINGKAVTTAESIRGTVRKMRNENIEVFNVIYIRDGLEQKKTIKAKKKNTGE